MVCWPIIAPSGLSLPFVCLFVAASAPPSPRPLLASGKGAEEWKGREGAGEGKGAVVADEWLRPAFPFTHLDRFQATTTQPKGKRKGNGIGPFLPPPSLGCWTRASPAAGKGERAPKGNKAAAVGEWMGEGEKEGRRGNGLGLCEEEKTMRREEGVRGKMRTTGRREEKAGREWEKADLFCL